MYPSSVAFSFYKRLKWSKTILYFSDVFVLLLLLRQNQINQIFHYTPLIMPKRVTSLRGSFSHHSVRATQLLSKKCRNYGYWQPLGNSVPDLTCPRFEPQTYHSRDKLTTARPTCRGIIIIIICLNLHNIA